MITNWLERINSTQSSIFVGYLQLIRLPNLFTAASNIVAAHLIATGGSPLWLPLSFTIFASLCFYHGGMVLNDCLDFDEDKRSRSQRPLPAGLISLTVAWSLGVGLLLLGISITYILGMQAFVIGISLTTAIIIYNLSNKNGFFGCIMIGLCRSLNWCLGLSIISNFWLHWPIALLVGIYVAALTLISRDETQAKRPQLLFFSGGAMTLGTAAYVVWTKTLEFWAIGLLGAALIFVWYRLILIYRRYQPEQIQTLVMFLVLGLIPLDAILLFISGYFVGGIIVLSFIVPGRVLARHLYVT